MISATYHCPQHDTFSMTLYSDTAPVYLDCPKCGIPSRVRSVIADDPAGKSWDKQVQELQTWVNNQFAMNKLNETLERIGYKLNEKVAQDLAAKDAEKKKQVHEALAREAMRRAMDEFTLPIDTGTDNLGD